MFKKLMLWMGLFFFVACPCAYGAQGFGSNLSENKIFDAVPIAVGESVTSQEFKMPTFNPRGYFSVQIYLNDTDADIDFYYEVSNDGTNWIRPADSDGTRVALLFNNFEEDAGLNGDGRELRAFSPVIAKFIRFVVAEGDLNNVITGFTAYVVWQ